MKKFLLVLALSLLSTFSHAASSKNVSVLTLQMGSSPVIQPLVGMSQPGYEILLVSGGLFTTQSKPQSWITGYTYQTGPVLYQTSPYDYRQGAQFGPGGMFTVAVQTEACPNICTFSGTWVSYKLEMAMLSTGNFVYTASGELTGTFTDPSGVQHNATASYSQHLEPEPQMFGMPGNYGLGGGGLTVLLTD